MKELREHVERLFGEEQLRTVNLCLRTIRDRREFSRYNFNEGKGRMEDVLWGHTTFELSAALLWVCSRLF